MKDDLYSHSNRFVCTECSHSVWVRWWSTPIGEDPSIPMPVPECHGDMMQVD